MIGTLGTLHISKNRQSGGSSDVTSAIQLASARTGVDFGYLVKQADIESSMNPQAKARSSSASGLYQFIEQTWLRMVKTHGAEHGYGDYADAIKQTGSGTYTVANRRLKSEILHLRNDAQASSLMAAELATENNAYLQQTVGGDVSGTDLYLAHFLGAQGAANFLNSMKKNPWAPAASFFPEAARANRGVFYQNGRPLSLQAVYNRFDSKFDGAATPFSDTAPARYADTEEVVLPAARSWSNPLSGSGSRRLGTLAMAGTDSGASLNASRMGSHLRSPVDVMEIAQTGTHYKHDDENRYNS